MKDFILGLIIGLVMGVWVGVNLGQGQDIFSNPFNFLSKNKQVAAVQQMDNTPVNNSNKLDSEQSPEKTINNNSPSSMTSEIDNKSADDSVLKSFMSNFD